MDIETILELKKKIELLESSNKQKDEKIKELEFKLQFSENRITSNGMTLYYPPTE